MDASVFIPALDLFLRTLAVLLGIALALSLWAASILLLAGAIARRSQKPELKPTPPEVVD